MKVSCVSNNVQTNSNCSCCNNTHSRIFLFYILCYNKN
nr:MAG TPA: hypothetical protein [Caudoviricetes sp.]